MPPPDARQVRDLRLEPRKIAALRANVMQQQLARWVQADTAWQALKNLIAELILEPVDPSVQGRGGDVHVFRRLANRPGTDHAFDEFKVSQMPQNHPITLTGAFGAPLL